MVDIFKPCIKCGEIDRNENSGRCNPCNRARLKLYYSKNAERMNQRKPSPKAAEYSAQWRRKNPDYVYVASELSKQNSRKWREKNKDKMRAYFIKWKNKNPAVYSEARKKFSLNNAEKIKSDRKAHTQNRRQWAKANGGRISSDLSSKLFILQGGKCACCSEPLSDTFHLDHIIPLSRGGKNEDRNIQLLLPACNLRKGAKDPIDYMREMGKLL